MVDQFRYTYRLMTGDATVIARVTSLEPTHVWAKAGVMMRESLSSDAAHAFALVSASNGVAFQRRSVAGGVSVHSGASGASPVWLKLERRGSVFSAFRSADGRAWTLIARASIAMRATIYVGLAVTSHNVASLATARFSSVRVDPLLPSGWSTADIGAPAPEGSVAYLSGRFVARGGGADIWGTSDQFRFVYRRMSGDVDLVARVASVIAADVWSKAGVMIRASLRPDAAHASVFASGARGLAFQRRPATALPSLHTAGGAGAAPVWVKLERRGTAVTAFRSADGVSWTMIGSETMSLPSTFYVGVAVTSHDPGVLAAAVFERVSARVPIVSAPAVNVPPTVALTSPLAGAAFTAPASIALSASAADPDGAVSRVEFYAGSTLLGTDTTSPFTLTWSNVAAGSYSLTAVARDNYGAATRSAAQTVIVNAPAPPSQARFMPSPDHAQSVTYYWLEIFTAGADPDSSVPMATLNLGKPPVVNGECTADIGATVRMLPAGRYFAALRAIGPGGASARTVSGAFTR